MFSLTAQAIPRAEVALLKCQQGGFKAARRCLARLIAETVSRTGYASTHQETQQKAEQSFEVQRPQEMQNDPVLVIEAVPSGTVKNGKALAQTDLDGIREWSDAHEVSAALNKKGWMASSNSPTSATVHLNKTEICMLLITTERQFYALDF